MAHLEDRDCLDTLLSVRSRLERHWCGNEPWQARNASANQDGDSAQGEVRLATAPESHAHYRAWRHIGEAITALSEALTQAQATRLGEQAAAEYVADHGSGSVHAQGMPPSGSVAADGDTCVHADNVGADAEALYLPQPLVPHEGIKQATRRHLQIAGAQGVGEQPRDAVREVLTRLANNENVDFSTITSKGLPGRIEPDANALAGKVLAPGPGHPLAPPLKPARRWPPVAKVLPKMVSIPIVEPMAGSHHDRPSLPETGAVAAMAGDDKAMRSPEGAPQTMQPATLPANSGTGQPAQPSLPTLQSGDLLVETSEAAVTFVIRDPAQAAAPEAVGTPSPGGEGEMPPWEHLLARGAWADRAPQAQPAAQAVVEEAALTIVERQYVAHAGIVRRVL